MVGVVVSMPLPDADKKSPRVYKNLKTIDLENVTFSEMESTGDPISIEMLNEDELRRLVLVNLARLSVKGEWNGLLTAGGGGGGPYAIPPSAMNSSFIELGPLATFSASQVFAESTSTNRTFTNTNVYCFPFIAPISGTTSKMFARVGSPVASTEMEMGLYTDNNGAPGSKMGGDTFFANSGPGNVSIDLSVALTAGTQYWVAYCKTSGSSNNPSMACHLNGYVGYANNGAMTNTKSAYKSTDTGSLPSDMATSGFETEYAYGMYVTLQFA
tara:strand:+ start:2677 stop:3489 length:813 start_codon:yes stop_codon:yes gene_type:complete